MKVTDYIVEFLIEHDITDVFGYPGGVICHFIDSVAKHSNRISAHINYHEQAAAFAACGFAQESKKIGVAFATSGPGATNLVTGIANAYFDSTPVIFLTGQVDTYGLKGDLPIRQRGFQETDVVSIVKSITKYSARVDNPERIKRELEKAYYEALSGNPGPVLLDLPADVQRADVAIEDMEGFVLPAKEENETSVSKIERYLKQAKRPCLLVGNGVKQADCTSQLRSLVEKIKIPAVFSMPAFDVLPFTNEYNYGFIGANGHRYGNFVLGKADLIISLGSRLDLKQVGNNRNEFATQAKIVRVDIDSDAFTYPVHEDDVNIQADIKNLLVELLSISNDLAKGSEEWNCTCKKIKRALSGYDEENYTRLLKNYGESIPDNSTITLDVGQSEVWCAQQLHIKENQSVHMSAGHGAMGYSLPAAIGCYYANKRPVYSFNGDGGIQMNIQELQFLSREKIPVHVIVINNRALGMIRGFQEANFKKNYQLTTEESGYTVPDFKKIAGAYGLQYGVVSSLEEINKLKIDRNRPSIIELSIPVDTLLNPNFGRNGLIQDQRPYIDRALFEDLMKL